MKQAKVPQCQAILLFNLNKQRAMIASLGATRLYICGMEWHQNGMYINANVTCCASVASPYYKQKLGPSCCHNCGTVITDSEKIAEINKLCGKFSIVKPACGAATCPDHQTSRPKKVKSKPAQRKQKRKAIKTEVKVQVKKHRKLNDGSKGVSRKTLDDFFKKK